MGQAISRLRLWLGSFLNLSRLQVLLTKPRSLNASPPAIRGLPDDVWTNIFQQLRQRAPDEEESRIVSDIPPGQADLSRVMRVNKVFHDLAGQVLYHSIVTQDLQKLLAGLVTIDHEPYILGLRRTIAILNAIDEEGRRRYNLGAREEEGKDTIGVSSDSPNPLARIKLSEMQDLDERLQRETGEAHRSFRGEICLRNDSRSGRLTIRHLLALTNRLHLTCPRHIDFSRGVDPISAEVTTGTYEDRLQYYFGLWQASCFLVESTVPVFPNMRQLVLGTPQEYKEKLDAVLLTLTQNHSLEGLHSDACEQLCSFIAGTEVQSICLYQPTEFIRIGRPKRCLVVPNQTHDGRPRAPAPLLTLHSVDVDSLAVQYRCVSVGCRVRFILRPDPDWSNMYCLRPRDISSISFSDLMGQLEEIRILVTAAKDLPEWADTEVELVLLPVDGARFARASEDSTGRRQSGAPEMTQDELDATILSTARGKLRHYMEGLKVTDWEKKVRIVSSVAESPWGDCPC